MTLQAHDITVQVGGATILESVDLAVRSGELVALVGPNGAGKSTLLAVLAGDVIPTAGAVELEGHALAGIGARDLARRRAVLLQRQTLAFGFTVREVVAMGRAPWYRTAAAHDDDAIIDEALRLGDIAPLAERLFPSLSGGEQGRAAFARVIAQKAQVVLLDEPTAALDLKHQEQLLGIARLLADEGVAVVTVLHDLSLAAAWADRICVLSHGRVVADGEPAAVVTPELVGAVYEHPVDVLHHGDRLVVVPHRLPASQPRDGSEEPACPAAH